MTRQCYTSQEIRKVVTAVEGGADLVAACRSLGFCYPSIYAQLTRLGLTTIIQRTKRATRSVARMQGAAALRERRLQLSLQLESAMPWEREAIREQIEEVDREVAKIETVAAGRKLRKPKLRRFCCTCRKPLQPGATWAYCSKRCEENRKARQACLSAALEDSGALPPGAPKSPQGNTLAPEHGASVGRTGAERAKADDVAQRPDRPGRDGTTGTTALASCHVIDAANERLLDLKGLVEWIAKRTGRRPHVNGARRWLRTGIRGIRLPNVMVAGCRYTSEEALAWWIAATSAACEPVDRQAVSA